jgi:hypothetical protein
MMILLFFDGEALVGPGTRHCFSVVYLVIISASQMERERKKGEHAKCSMQGMKFTFGPKSPWEGTFMLEACTFSNSDYERDA